jgi:hypothetical protein
MGGGDAQSKVKEQQLQLYIYIYTLFCSQEPKKKQPIFTPLSHLLKPSSNYPDVWAGTLKP